MFYFALARHVNEIREPSNTPPEWMGMCVSWLVGWGSVYPAVPWKYELTACCWIYLRFCSRSCMCCMRGGAPFWPLPLTVCCHLLPFVPLQRQLRNALNLIWGNLIFHSPLPHLFISRPISLVEGRGKWRIIKAILATFELLQFLLTKLCQMLGKVYAPPPSKQLIAFLPTA